MTDNRLVLTGVVIKPPRHSTSPAGVPHCYFEIEHRSQQIEATLSRHTYLRMPVVVSGSESQPQTHGITAGCTLRAAGFITSHKTRSGQFKLVLHAHQIEMI